MTLFKDRTDCRLFTVFAVCYVSQQQSRRIRLSSARASHAYRQTSTHAYTHTSLGMFQPSWVSFLDWPWLKGMLLHHLQVFGLACGCVCQPGPEKFQRPRREKAETILPSRRLKEQSTGRRSSRANYILKSLELAQGTLRPRTCARRPLSSP